MEQAILINSDIELQALIEAIGSTYEDTFIDTIPHLYKVDRHTISYIGYLSDNLGYLSHSMGVHAYLKMQNSITFIPVSEKRWSGNNTVAIVTLKDNSIATVQLLRDSNTAYCTSSKVKYKLTDIVAYLSISNYQYHVEETMTTQEVLDYLLTGIELHDSKGHIYKGDIGLLQVIKETQVSKYTLIKKTTIGQYNDKIRDNQQS